MNAVNPLMLTALAGFAPKAASKADPDREALERICGLPFELSVLTAEAVTNCEPDFGGPAEYADVIADEDLVIDAVAALVQRHYRELECDVEQRMEKRAKDARNDY